MSNKSSAHIRKLWNEFCQAYNHVNIGSASLIPDQIDKTVLFTTAGMQPLVPYLMGKNHPNGKRLYNIQKCLRTVDIDEVGDERHLTFFEMMGNRSLGDFFKEESLRRSVEFLTKYLDIPFDKIGITIYSGEGINAIGLDETAATIAKDIGFPTHKIVSLDAAENFWGPAGKVGPCGPCAELYVDRGSERGPDDRALGTNDRYIEIRNNVFMEFYKHADGRYEKLQNKNIDTGMGLERITMILQNKQTVFETDLFVSILESLEKLTGLPYEGFTHSSQQFGSKKQKNIERFRVIADHVKSALFIIADGAIPSNEGRGYIVRKLLRRAYYNYFLLQNRVIAKANPKQLIESIYQACLSIYSDYYPELQNISIVAIAAEEVQKFSITIIKGLETLENFMSRNNTALSGSDAFVLYDTYGMPFEITQEIAKEKNIDIDVQGFIKSQKRAQELSRKSKRGNFDKGHDWSAYITGIPRTKIVSGDTLDTTDSAPLKHFFIGKNEYIIFDKSPFYATGGGQISDTGVYIDEQGNTKKIIHVLNYADVLIHQIGT